MKQKKIIIISLLLLAVAAGVVFLFSQHRGKPALNTVDIRIPLSYTQPLVIATFDLDFVITPREARAAEREELAENRFRYTDAYPNTDVVQTRETNKLKEDIILKRPGHPSQFVYRIDDTGLEARFDSEGNLRLYPKGEDMAHTRFFIPAPFLIDAKGEKSSTKDVVMVYENGTLTLVPNPVWLSKHPYPITLDPTVEITVLNVNSVPTVDGPWEVRFTTIGTDTLVITGDPDNTVYGVNVEPESLSCGDRELSGEALRQAQDDNTFRIVNWSCDTEATWTVKVLKPGHHHQTFQFGGQTAEASNDTVSNDWCAGLSAWNNRRKITLNNSAQSTAHTNFPAMVALTQAADVNNIDYAKTQNSGQDIRFCDQDNATSLDYEIEKWDETATSTVWVEVPNITAASSTEHIWMYYGNSSASDNATTTGVWDASFVGVWHLDEGDSTAANFYQDSTSNANHGTLTDANGNSVAATGKVDGAFDFNGDADVLSMGNPNSLSFGTGSFTVTAWVKSDVTTGGDSVVANADSVGAEKGYQLKIFHGGSVARFNVYDGSIDASVGGSALSIGTWYYMAGVVNRSANTAYLYLDGIQNGTSDITSLGNLDVPDNFNIGALDNSDRFVNGIIDVVRISNVARSADWIAFEYCNMNFTCNTYGSEEGYPRPADVPGVKFR